MTFSFSPGPAAVLENFAMTVRHGEWVGLLSNDWGVAYCGSSPPLLAPVLGEAVGGDLHASAADLEDVLQLTELGDLRERELGEWARG